MIGSSLQKDPSQAASGLRCLSRSQGTALSRVMKLPLTHLNLPFEEVITSCVWIHTTKEVKLKFSNVCEERLLTRESPSEGRLFFFFYCPHQSSTSSSSHILSNSCAYENYVWDAASSSGIHAVTACVFCPLGCRSLPDNVTGEGREHRTASS